MSKELNQVQLFQPIYLLWCLLVFIISSLLIHKIIGLVVLLITLLLIYYITHVKMIKTFFLVLRWWPILLITFIIHIVLSARFTGYYLQGIYHVNILSNALFFVFRVTLMFIAIALLFQAFPPQSYGRAIGKVIGKLRFGRRFWSQLELSGTLALRFIPFMHDESKRLNMVLLSHKSSHNNKKLFRKLIIYEKLLFPLLVSSLRRADNIAMALVARGFNNDVQRTYYNDMQFNPKGIFITVLLTALCITAPML